MHAHHLCKNGTNQGQKDNNLKMVEDIDFGSIPHGKETPIRVHHHSYDPRPCEMQKTAKNERKEFTGQLKALQVPCGFLHLLTNPNEETPKVHSLPLTPCSIQAKMRHKMYQGELPPLWKLIEDYDSEFIAGITDQEKVIVEKSTRLQNAAMRWHEERFNRLT